MDKHTATELAYKKGYIVGKTEMRNEIFEGLADMFNEKYDVVKAKKAEFADGTDSNTYWTGRLVSYGEILKALDQLKETYKET